MSRAVFPASCCHPLTAPPLPVLCPLRMHSQDWISTETSVLGHEAVRTQKFGPYIIRVPSWAGFPGNLWMDLFLRVQKKGATTTLGLVGTYLLSWRQP